ncbi:hypothetical protein GCM10010466_07370 [Planomonospora alba]|uniref:Uncharacterized protein n=1 Tax=Planomonospora alba TaxID=161354 RepID=A0ABP6MQH5_9ACTN
MAKRTTEALNVEVDDPALSLVGWRIEDIRARLVTIPDGKNNYVQYVDVSGTARFHSEDWLDRFSRSPFVPPIVITFNRRDSVTPPSYKLTTLESIKTAKNTPVRIIESSYPWECKKPYTPHDLDLRITAYDIIQTTGSDFSLPPKKSSILPVEIVDETTLRSVLLKPENVLAYILRDKYKEELRVHAQGILEFGSVDELLEEDWHNPGLTLNDNHPFEIEVPKISIDILDDEDFFLETHEVGLYSCIPVNASGKLPSRQPRWTVSTGEDIDTYMGEPARAIVRIVDPEAT